MNILTKLTNFVSGGLFKEIKDAVTSYWPPDMTPQQKAEAELKLERFLHQKQMDVNEVLQDAAAQLDKRINEQEGTAKDLMGIPFLGPIVLFARGIQRPVWGFATLYMDNKWFFGSNLEFNEQQQTAMIVINVLVLGFLFGERAIKNLEPLLLKVFAK